MNIIVHCIHPDFTFIMKHGKRLNSHPVFVSWDKMACKNFKNIRSISMSGFRSLAFSGQNYVIDMLNHSVTDCRQLVLPGKVSFIGRTFSLFAYPLLLVKGKFEIILIFRIILSVCQNCLYTILYTISKKKLSMFKYKFQIL